MMKKYFTDGLIQIAIVLSLLRTDLNLNNLHNYVNNYPEIHEIILGTSSAYTQTNIHSQGWLNDGTNGYAHPKSIDNYYTNSILGELHSLSRYRRVRQRDNDIDAWLVVGQSLPIPSETQSVGGTAQPQIPAHSSIPHPPDNQVQQGQAQPEGAVGPTNDNSPDLVNLPIEFPGSELTKEDMDLIEILWRQDMDLGVGREVYDLNMRRELEKERELELLKEQEKEQQEQQLKVKEEEQQQQQQQNLNFIIDGETGEVIQVPIPATDTYPADPLTPPQQVPVDGYKVLEEEQEFLQQQQQQQQYLQQQQQYLQQQQQTQVPQPIEPESNTDLQDEIEAIIASASQQFNATQPEQEDAEGVLEAQWAEVAELLSQEELGLDVVGSGALLQNATLSAAISHTPGSFNQTVAELSSAAPGGYSMMPPSTMTNQTFEPFPAATATNETMNDPTYGSLFNLDSQHLMFSNMSMSGSGESGLDADRNSTLNHTENLLQELMETTNLTALQFSGPVDTAIMQSLQDSLAAGNVSSDSAVSSMSSPSHLQDVNETASVFSDHMSVYGSLQGATGGSDYDSAGETHSKVTKQVQHYSHPSYSHSDYDYHMSDSMMNQSIASNDSESHYADMTQVNHNHTYPMQPVPDPRTQRRTTTKVPHIKKEKNPLPEYDTRIASARDARKARQLKVPFSMDRIIHSSVDEFNEMLSKHELSEPQLQLIRDIRRRGKNKVAAQNCRKRKMDVITDLEEEVMRMRQKKEDLLRERQNVEHQRTEMKHKLDVMYQEVFSSMRDEHGQPYDPSRYSLQHAEDGSVLVVPRNCTRGESSHKEKSSKKKKSSKKN